VEADFGSWGRGWRLEQRAEFLKHFAQRRVVDKQSFVYLGEAPENGAIGREVLAHFDEGADDVNGHGNGAGAIDHGGGHQGTMLGESKG
jgi:hypothetical protein